MIGFQFPRRRFGRLGNRLVDSRWLTPALVTAVTLFTGMGHYNPRWLLPEPSRPAPVPVSEAAPGKAAPEEASPGSIPPDVDPIRVARGDVIVVARSDDFFTPAGAAAMRDAVAALESLDHVRQILWMDRAPPLNLFALRRPVYPPADASAARFRDAKQRALEHPLVRGQLLSADAKTMLLMVQIDWLFVEKDSDCTELLRRTAAEAAARHDSVSIDFQVTGNVPIRLSRAARTQRNEIKYQLIGYSMSLLMAWVLFRGLSAVVIVALAPIAGVFWTLGILNYVGLDDNPFNSVIVPVLLSMVGLTDGVHMMTQIRRHRAAGAGPRDAARHSMREVGLACWLTSLTTAIGFGSLLLARHEVVRDFGLSCVIGVLVTFVAVVTIIPWCSSTRLGRRVHIGYERSLVDQNLQRIGVVIDWVLRRSRSVSGVAIAITIVLSLATLQLRPDERLTSALASSSEPVRALSHIDRVMGGMETAQVAIHWSSEVAPTSGEIAAVVTQIDRALRTEPLIGHPVSIANLLAALPGEGDPATRMSLLELLPPPVKRAYFTPESRRAEVRFRVQDLGIARYGPVFERTEQRLAEIERTHPEFTLQLQGGAINRWKHLYQIVVDLALSLGTASAIILVVLAVVYRSVRLGLISIVPNLFPLAATGCLMIVTGQHLEIVSVCAFTICLGIAVDDTIHFLTRFREECRAGETAVEAIRKAFTGVGTALIITTVVLVIGFSTALLSDSRDHRIFATMGILTITSALFADLVFLPALLKRFAADRGPDSQADEPSPR